MVVHHNSFNRPQRRETLGIPFRRSALVVCILASFAMASSTHALTAEEAKSINDLQSENARLRQEIEALKQGTKPTSAPEVPISAVTETPRTETKKLGAVVVNGRRANPLVEVKETPKSISIVTGAELEKTQTNDFRNILTRIGNVGATYTNPQAGSLIIRGVGWATGAGPLDPSVGVTVDGVSYGVSGMASALNYTDLETVQVNRGPQGTLGGKNTSVGEIIVKTRAPAFAPEARASITYGQLNTINTEATIGGAVIDDLLAWRGTFLREQADGSWKNQNDKNYSYKNTDRTYGRAQFLLTPSDDFSALLALDLAPTSKEISDNYVNFNRATPTYYDSLGPDGKPALVNQANEAVGKLSRRWFTQEPNYTAADYTKNEINRLSQNPNNYGSKGAAATLKWNVASHTFSSITAYRDFDFDSGGGPISVFDIDRSPSTGHVEYQQYSQEFRINSETGGVIDYQGGLYYFQSKMPQRWTTARYGSDAGAYYANVAQYKDLDTDSAGRALMQNSIDRLFTKTKDDISAKSTAIFGNLNWHVTDPFTINTGLRLTHEQRETSSARFIVDQGFGAELNPLVSNNVQLGNAADAVAVQNAIAQKYFGVATYGALNPVQQKQIADAKAIRAARIGGLYQEADADSYDKWLPTITVSPTYKINENQTAYVSWQHGEKSGISQIVGATPAGGKSIPLKAEKSNTYELGLKSQLLDKTLVVNADVFLHDVKDYIQTVYFFDEAQTIANADGKLAYTQGLGNVPKVQSKGVELDATYSGIRYTTLRLAGAYTNAVYKDFQYLAKPLEQTGGTTVPYYDATGKTLPGSAKYTFNFSAEHVRPVFVDKEFHTNINYRYTSSLNNDPSLSRYAEVDAYGIADFAIGLGRRDRAFDVNIVVKNLFNTDHGFYSNWNTYFPSEPRWVGVMVSGSL